MIIAIIAFAFLAGVISTAVVALSLALSYFITYLKNLKLNFNLKNLTNCSLVIWLVNLLISVCLSLMPLDKDGNELLF